MNKRLLLSLCSILLSIFVYAQETITISGNIVDEKKQPLPGAAILAKGTTIGTVTDDAGNYQLKVPKETKTLIVKFVGYDDKEVNFNPKDGNQVVNVDMATAEIGLNQVVVSASKKKEKLLDAPASVSVLSQEQISTKVGTTPLDMLKTTTGVDVMRTGLVSSNVAIRGFNNIFSGAVLNVIDNRIGGVPSLRVNAYQLVPTSTLDYDRIEVVRGPASALYGPNASSGVIHIMTRSPLDQEKKFETTLAMTSGFTVLDKGYQTYGIGESGGQRITGNINPVYETSRSKKQVISGNIINPEIRHSGKLFNGKFGYKVSGSYFQGKDYPVYDSREPFDGDSIVYGSVANGKIFSPDSVTVSVYDSATGTNVSRRVPQIERFKKDFGIRKYTADARIDIKPIEDITLTINGGLASAKNVELTGLGAAQAGGNKGSWIYWYLQTRFRWKNLYVQYFINSSDAGNTSLIPQLSESARNSYGSTVPPSPYQVQKLIDKSKVHVIQAQHSVNPLANLGLIYGVDVFLTRPDTKGTINGRFENKDNLNQVGAYVQGDYAPLEWLKIVAAIRADYNSIVKNVAVSPRAALVFKPKQGHNIRITYNRAFDAPTTLNQFLDLSNGLIPNGINVRGIGNPYGWNYRYDETSNNMVQFKTAPWGGSTGQWVTFGNKTINTSGFDSLMNYMVKTFTGALGGNELIARSLVSAIFDGISGNGTVTNADQLSVDYANFATTKNLGESKQDVSSFKNLKKINNSVTQTLELGYKGLLFNKLSVQVDAYWTRQSNYVSALLSASGSVMLDHSTYLGQYDAVNAAIDTNGQLYKNLYANGAALNNLLVPILDGAASLQNSSIVPSVAGSVWDEFVVLTYQFPMGTITPDDTSLVGSDFIVTYQNLGRLDVFGIDFGLQYNIVENAQHSIMAGGGFSWVDKDQIKLSTGQSVSLNAPKFKASVTFDHMIKKPGIGYGVSFRYQAPYRANSSVYFGDVKPMYIVDARISYRPKFYRGLLLSINVNNINNYQWQSFPGTAKMGTQFFAKAQVTF
jgi:iron complex outermembrane receptor protein